MGTLAPVIIVVFSMLSLLGAFLLVRQRDPITAAILLILVSAGTGFVFLAMGAHLVGIIQLLVFTPLIGFVLKYATLELPDPNIRRDPVPMVRVAAAITITVLGLIIIIDMISVFKSGSGPIQYQPVGFTDFINIVTAFLSDWLYPVILVGMLATISAILTAHLARKPQAGKQEQNGLGPEGDSV